jgi:hypothetical protein
MSVASVSHRAMPLPMQSPAREPVKMPAKEAPHAKEAVKALPKEKPQAHAPATYEHPREKRVQHDAPKGHRVDIKA